MKTDITYEYGNNLYINLTNECPNRCDFCIRNNSSGSLYAENLWYSGKEPEKEEIWQEILKRDLNKYHQIVFCGYGEPACRWDDMMWLCDRLREKGSYFIRINTNGLGNLITGRDAASELDGRADCVSVSLNAADAEGYDAVCHSTFGKEAFPAILKFTSTAVFYVPRVYMTVVDTMEASEIQKCRRVCESLGAQLNVRRYIEN